MEREHSHSKPGRRGDPRMNRAVAARLANSSLSLYEALRAGGFDWSVSKDSSDGSTDKIFDSDGVSLSQRKNQLNRRLRQRKKKIAEEESTRNHELASTSCPHQDIQTKQSTLEVLPYAGTGAPLNDGNLLGHLPQEPHLAQPAETSQCASSTYAEIQDSMNQKIPYSDMKRTFPFIDDVSSGLVGKRPIETISSCSADTETKSTSFPSQWRGLDKDVDMAGSSKTVDFSLKDTKLSTASPLNTAGTPIAPEKFYSDERYKSEDTVREDTHCYQDPNISMISDEEKLKKAVDLFQAKNSILLKRSLLMAEFPPDQIMEGSDTFHDFAELATKEVLNTSWLNMMHSKGHGSEE